MLPGPLIPGHPPGLRNLVFVQYRIARDLVILGRWNVSAFLDPLEQDCRAPVRICTLCQRVRVLSIRDCFGGGGDLLPYEMVRASVPFFISHPKLHGNPELKM